MWSINSTMLCMSWYFGNMCWGFFSPLWMPLCLSIISVMYIFRKGLCHGKEIHTGFSLLFIFSIHWKNSWWSCSCSAEGTSLSCNGPIYSGSTNKSINQLLSKSASRNGSKLKRWLSSDQIWILNMTGV